MNTKEVPLESPIEEKIAWAEDSYQKFRDQLLKDKMIVVLISELKKAVYMSHKEMIETGIVDECRECEQNEGGSCCGVGLENKYDGVLLLINLLMGVELPKKRHDPESCFFLGEKGCTLKARHVICVNYLCKKITDRIDPRKIMRLREKEGIELEALFLLHERIKKALKT